MSITLKEWETRHPDSDSDLAGRSLGGEAERRLADRLAEMGMIEVTELRTGLMIRADERARTT